MISAVIICSPGSEPDPDPFSSQKFHHSGYGKKPYLFAVLLPFVRSTMFVLGFSFIGGYKI